MEEIMQIEGESNERAIQAMQDGLQNEDFIRIISRNSSRTFLEMLVEANKHISAEWIIESCRNSKGMGDMRNDPK